MHMRLLDRPPAAAPELDHLRALEAESIHILREVVAEFERPGDAVLDRQGLVGAAAAGAEGVSSRPDSVSAAARRHHLQVPGDDRVPRLVRGAGRRAADRPHQPRGDRRRHAAVRSSARSGAAACSRRARCSTRSTRADSTRRSAARGATKSGRAPRSACSRSATPRASGIRSVSGPSSGTSSTAASDRARASACSRSRTGPSSTSGTTSTSERIPVVPLYFAKERDVIVRGDSLIVPEQPFVPLLPGERPKR